MHKPFKVILVFVLLLALAAFRPMLLPEQWTPSTKAELQSSLEKLDKKMRGLANYEVNVTHLSFEDNTSDIVHDKATGFYRRDQKRYHSLMMGVETIQNENIKVVIDTAKKIIAVVNPDATLEHQGSPELRSIILDRTTSIMKSQQSQSIAFKIDFSENYSMTSCQLAMFDNSLIKEIVMCYSKKVKNHQGKEVHPKLKIQFTGWKEDVKFPAQEFSDAKYVVKEGKQYHLTSAYKNYKLQDQRFNIK